MDTPPDSPEERRKRRLLQWVQAVVPGLGVEDFTACWHDGLALCWLLEELCPGLCPRPHLLNPHHRVNNCRLGIKLAQRYLGVTTTLIRAEEMAIADTDMETNLMRLIQLIKWRHQQGGSPSLQASVSPKTRLSASTQPVPVQLVARGTGLKAGIVGRRAKFNILTDSAPFLDLHIEIQGPNNEVNSEHITSLNQGLDRRQARARSPPGYPVTSEEEGKSKLIEDDVGNVFLRQKSVEEELQQNVIPFDYQCVGEGRFLVTYIPRSAGTYFISIKSYEVDIEGSPFEVKVSDWMTSWNVMPKPRVMSFDMLPSIEEAPHREKTSPLRDAAKDLKRPSAGASQLRMAQVSRQLTIMKKRVLKRIITRNGEEILLTPSPTLSRQSSADVSDMSEDEKSLKSDGKSDRSGRSPNRGRNLGPESSSTELVKEKNSSAEREGCGNSSRAVDKKNESRNNSGMDQDFSNNSCNITLSVTSFEDEQEEEKKKKNQKDPSSLQPPPLTDSSTTSPVFKESSSTITYNNTPGMYPSTPKRLAKIPESPIHINVRSQLLGPTNTPKSSTYTTISNDRTSTNNGGGAQTQGDNSHRYSQHLRVSSRCRSPSSSDDASGEHSDFTEFDLSPGPSKFDPDFPELRGATSSTAPNLPSEELDNRSKTSNRRRFEESLSHRDGDADDSGDACSQLVSALTEFDPHPPKKTVGRSYSDGAKGVATARNGHYNIRLKRMEVQGGEGWWRKTAGEHDTTTTHSPQSFQPTHNRSQTLQPHHVYNPGFQQKEDSLSSSHSPHSEASSSEHPGPQTLSPFTSSSSGSQSSGPEEKHTREQERRREETERRPRMLEARKKWKTFDGSTIVEEEGERGMKSTWRFSLQGKRSHSFTAPGWHHHHPFGTRGWMSEASYNLSTELENMSIIDKLNDDDDEILEVVIESDYEPERSNTPERGTSPEEEPEPENAEGNEFQESETGLGLESCLTSLSVKQTIRGNLSRQDNVTGSNKSSSETSTETDKSRTTSTEASLPEKEELEGRRFRTIQKQKRRTKGSKSVSILVPKPKTDKSTQVSYSEIKTETGWKPPTLRLHRRKKYLKVTNTTTTTTSTGNSNHPATSVLSRESSLSGNTDHLSASPAKASRLSSKSSSFSDTSLIFGGSDGAEFPENLATKQFQSGNTRLEVHRVEMGMKDGEEGISGISLGKGGLENTSKVENVQREEGGEKEISTVSTHHPNLGTKTATTTSQNKNTAKDARPPPYGRARSDPQFTRRPYFPEDVRDGMELRGSLLGRPPRPRDLHVLDWVQHATGRDVAADHEQPERQSTVDTLDSGIENESPNYTSFVSGHRRIHRRPYPWSIDLEPSLVRANAAALELDDDPFSGHRRLSRRQYPWEMDLDPRLIQDNGGSRQAGENSSHDSLQLTLGVIEAAVHHTVRRLLSASSVASSGSHRNLPNIFREREDSREEGDRDGKGSYSDSELYTYLKEEVTVKRKKRKRKRKPGGTLSRTSSTVKEDFVRSVPILPDEPTGAVPRQSSPDIAETKSDGRYSPYSVTDIPCFELPSQSTHLRRSLLKSPTRNIRKFPHPSHPTRSSSSSSKHPLSPPAQQYSSRQMLLLLQQQQQQSQESVPGTEKERCEPAVGSSSKASSSGKTSLALRRQIGTRSPTSSPEMLAGMGVDLPDHKRGSDSKKLQHLRSLSLEKGVESDTNTSEDSCSLVKKTSPGGLEGGGLESRLHAQISGNPRIVIHGSGQNAKQSKFSSSSTEDSCYQGFGLSRNQRHELIDHLRGFRDLTERQKWESPEGSRKGLSPTPSSENELCLTETSSCYLSQYSDPFDDHSPLSSASLFAQKSFFQEGDLEAFKSISPTGQTPDPPNQAEVAKPRRDRLESGSASSIYSRDMALSPLQAKVATARVKDDEAGSDVAEGPDEKGGRCVAFGAGLSFGQVGEENNFQVWTERPGNSCVTVAVFGPRSHCVTETSVTYIGDNLYDVSYSVTSPGYYVIVVKWGDQSLPDSPYICKVTY